MSSELWGHRTVVGLTSLAILVVGAGCAGVTLTDGGPDDQRQPEKVTDRLNESLSVDGEESLVVVVTLERDLSPEAVDQTVTDIDSHVDRLRGVYLDGQSVYVRATGDQIHGLTAIDAVTEVDIAPTATSNG